MPFDRSGSIDMKDFVPVGYKPIGNQHAMAAKIHAFGAHVSSARLRGQFDQFGDAAMEILREHVVGIIAEAVIAKRDVGRVVAELLASSAKLLEPEVPNPGLGQGFLQSLAIEMRQAA